MVSRRNSRLPPGRALVAVFLVSVALVGSSGPSWAQSSVVATEGSVAVGSDVRDSQITITGWTPEEVRELIIGVMRDEPAKHATELAALSQQLDVTQGAVVTFLDILGRNPDLPPERLLETLAQIAERHRAMLVRLRILNSIVRLLGADDSDIAPLIEAAQTAIEEGDHDRAKQLMANAEAREIAAIGMPLELAREAQQATAARQRLSVAAALRAQRGELRLAQLDYLGAAEAFRAAAERVPADAQVERGDYLNRYAGALSRQPLAVLVAAERDVASHEMKASRLFASPRLYPPTDFAAYGIVAFKARASEADFDRHMMVCNAYLATLPHAKELNVAKGEQMATVWPVMDDNLAQNLNYHSYIVADALREPDGIDTSAVPTEWFARYGYVCTEAIKSYNLTMSERALRAARSTGMVTPGSGPFLLAWSPALHKGRPDALVLSIDLSNVTTYDQMRDIFTDWRSKIERDPALWRGGWSVEGVRREIRLWFDKYGVMVLQFFGA